VGVSLFPYASFAFCNSRNLINLIDIYERTAMRNKEQYNKFVNFVNLVRLNAGAQKPRDLTGAFNLTTSTLLIDKSL